MPLEIQIATGGSAPIYRQIADGVCRAVVTGALAEGERLPSVRTLAERLAINPNTIARAYGDLIREGVLEGRPGKGVFVAPRRPVYTRAERLRRIAGPLDAFVNAAMVLGWSPGEILRLVEERIGRIEHARTGGGGDSHG